MNVAADGRMTGAVPGGRRALLAGLAIAALLAAPWRAAAQAEDEVAQRDGTTLSGNILAESYDGLEIQVKKGVTRNVTWDKVASITYGDPPDEYTQAMASRSSAPEEALSQFQALAANGDLRDVLRQHALVEVAALQQQLGQPAEAAASWQALAKAFPVGRHIGAAARGVVESNLAQNNPTDARSALDALAKEAQAAKVPASFEAEVNLLRGQILASTGKCGEARVAFELAEKQPDAPPEVLALVKLATAQCLLAEGKAAEAEGRFKAIVDGEGPSYLLAGGWNGLGDLLLEQGRQKRDSEALLGALYAYLRGVVQYVPGPGEPTAEHEKAIARSADCFLALAQIEQDKERKAAYEQRAMDERKRLERLFPRSSYLPK